LLISELETHSAHIGINGWTPVNIATIRADSFNHLDWVMPGEKSSFQAAQRKVFFLCVSGIGIILIRLSLEAMMWYREEKRKE